jgi:formiminotetrahydrofolate cyclodeaminase
MAAGLASMVAEISRNKPACATFETALTAAITRLGTLREELKASIDADARAYQEWMLARKAFKNATSEQDATQVSMAQREIISVPLHVAECAAEVGALAKELRVKTLPSMATDLVTAVALVRAAISGSLANVETNLAMLEPGPDGEFAAAVRMKVASLRKLWPAQTSEE